VVSLGAGGSESKGHRNQSAGRGSRFSPDRPLLHRFERICKSRILLLSETSDRKVIDNQESYLSRDNGGQMVGDANS